MQETWGKGKMRCEIGRAAWGPPQEASPSLPSLELNTQRLGLLQKSIPQLRAIDTAAAFWTQPEDKHIIISFAFLSILIELMRKKKVQWHQQPPKNSTKIPSRISKNRANSLCSIIIHARKKRNHLCKKNTFWGSESRFRFDFAIDCESQVPAWPSG